MSTIVVVFRLINYLFVWIVSRKYSNYSLTICLYGLFRLINYLFVWIVSRQYSNYCLHLQSINVNSSTSVLFRFTTSMVHVEHNAYMAVNEILHSISRWNHF